MKLLRLLGTLAACLALVACETVSSLQPVGDQPTAIEKNTWQGTWLLDDGVMHVKVLDAKQGKMLLVTIDLDGNKLEDITQAYHVYARHSGNHKYLSLLNEDTGDKEYLFGKYDFDGKHVRLYLPKQEAFIAAVKSGRLKARHNKDYSEIVLTGTDANTKAFLENTGNFEDKSSLVFRRLDPTRLK